MDSICLNQKQNAKISTKEDMAMSCALSKGLVPRVPEKWNKDNPEDPGSTLREEAREVLGEPADTINPDLPVKGDKPAGKKMV